MVGTSGAIAAMIASAVIGAASSAYSADEQRRLAAAAKKERDRAALAAKEEQDRIAKDTRPDEEALGEIVFGADGEKDEFGSTEDFLVPKVNNTLGGSTGRSGLGFKV